MVHFVCGYRYQDYLRRARSEAFSDLAQLNAFYKAGNDYLGRTIMVYVGNKFPASQFDPSRVSSGRGAEPRRFDI